MVNTIVLSVLNAVAQLRFRDSDRFVPFAALLCAVLTDLSNLDSLI
jgi:hypothetical protein